jgi:ferredoxin
MAAIEEEEIKRSEYILCWNCVSACPVYAVKLTAGPPRPEYRLDLADTGRRAFLAAGISAVPAVLLAVKMRFWHRGAIPSPTVNTTQRGHSGADTDFSKYPSISLVIASRGPAGTFSRVAAPPRRGNPTKSLRGA